ncbi:macro domain-containing protein [uncultured Bacteroides sp.]|uniref:macro domain-containing protein n=1 Tax=uncultured Bacteroides sp. TaxID=162156 RepID=UPI00259905F8|nr:macro domain-containing protein [uncultured Bacteroides sp.]
MIKYIKNGNIFTIDGTNSYAHGCNCAGAMGKSIALQFRSKYPDMYKQYKKLCIDGQFILGDVFEYRSGNERIYNLGTQKTWRTHADLVAIKKAIGKMLILASQSNVKSIALPKIGAGLGGLNWDDVKSAIEEVAASFPDIELVIVENYSE